MTAAARPFDVVFLTNFSNLCFRAIPALAQMSDEIDVRLTILHAYDEVRSERRLEENLRNFFPEADHFTRCRRVLERGSAFEAIRRLRAEQPVDLVIAPAGDPLGFPRPGHASLRSRIVHETGTPLWSNGAGTDGRRLVRPTRSVACVVEPGRRGHAHLRLAGEYAERLGAVLHVAYLLPDLFDEGSLLMMGYEDPFDVPHATKLLRREVPGTTLVPEVHVTDRGRLPELLAALDADVAFLDGARWSGRRWLRRRMHPMVDALPCPTMCVVAGRDDLHWPLRQPARHVHPETRREEMPASVPQPVAAVAPVLVGVPAAPRATVREQELPLP